MSPASGLVGHRQAFTVWNPPQHMVMRRSGLSEFDDPLIPAPEATSVNVAPCRIDVLLDVLGPPLCTGAVSERDE
jgi:hypothetical protein